MRMRAAFIALSVLAAAGCATSGTKEQPPPAAEKAPDKPAFRLVDIAGRDAKALDKLLGAPALTRKEGVGEFRRYAFESCALIVILYPDEKGALTAKTVEAAAKISGEPKPDLGLCLAKGLVKQPAS